MDVDVQAFKARLSGSFLLLKHSKYLQSSEAVVTPEVAA